MCPGSGKKCILNDIVLISDTNTLYINVNSFLKRLRFFILIDKIDIKWLGAIFMEEEEE